MTKVCNKCKVKKDLSEFQKEERGLYGRRSDCKYCRKIYKAKYYLGKKETYQKRNALWFQNNKERRKNYETDRRKLPHRKISNMLRSRVREAMNDDWKSGSAVRDLGCSIEQLKTYFESKFEEGMSWDNHGINGWHIDHIVPLSSFDLTDREQFLRACHYTNLQPLWAKENLRKGSKIL